MSASLNLPRLNEVKLSAFTHAQINVIKIHQKIKSLANSESALERTKRGIASVLLRGLLLLARKLISGRDRKLSINLSLAKTLMALWRLYYHLVWATKMREPMINSQIEAPLYRYIIGKADALACIVHALGGIEDHIHLVVSIPPSLSLADFVKNVKGSSAHYVNHTLSASPNKFAWQEGYGVFSLGGKQLDTAVAYVQNQKAHHLNGSAIASLEQETNLDNAPQLWYAK